MSLPQRLNAIVWVNNNISSGRSLRKWERLEMFMSQDDRYQLEIMVIEIFHSRFESIG